MTLGWSLSIAGCGGGPPKSADSPADEPADLEGWLERLAASERALESELGGSDGIYASQPGSMPKGGAPVAPEPPAPADAPAAEAEAESPATRQPSPCETACRALASMQRSAERICELTAPNDQRCSDARQRVSRAEQRVVRAGCACDA